MASPTSSPSPLCGALAALALLAAAPAQASEGGLTIFPDGRILVLIVFFALLIPPVQRLLLAPLLRILDEREARIAGTRERAARVAAEADQVLERYEAAVREARAEAELARRRALAASREEQLRTTAQARAEAEAELGHARQQVDQALATARAGLRARVEPLAREAAARALGRSLS